VTPDSADPGSERDQEVVRAYLGLGSNLGDRLAQLQGAVDGLAATEGVTVVAVSPVYETEPIGPDQPEYLNAVVAVETARSARWLLELAQTLERAAHRVRGKRWGPRTLDVDVLVFGWEVIEEPDLVVPHPRMWERGFVMAPLHDLEPELGIRGLPPGGWAGVRRTDLSLRAP
jgi:2-amino-4-hydroxy-6-hydroxymethyldihydropteridine diphosphokinase